MARLPPEVDTSRQSKFYEIDGASLGPTARSVRLKAVVGSQIEQVRQGVSAFGGTIRTKLSRSSGAPTVNMNRGNSQFLDTVPDHSRTSATVSNNHHRGLTLRGRIGDLWDRLHEHSNFHWRLERKEYVSSDPFASQRGLETTEEGPGLMGNTLNLGPDFSQSLAMEQRKLQDRSELHGEAPAGADSPTSSSLATAGAQPRAEPTTATTTSLQRTKSVNPFADPTPSRPPLLARTPSTPSRYRARYSSSIAQSDSDQTSYRDTMMTMESSDRRGRGRSDPFDLDRPDLYQPGPVPIADSHTSLNGIKGIDGVDPQGTTAQRRDPDGAQPRAISLQRSRITSDAGTYSSKYSSGQSLGAWGEPGPDLGRRDQGRSLQGILESDPAVTEYGWTLASDGGSVSSNGVGKAM